MTDNSLVFSFVEPESCDNSFSNSCAFPGICLTIVETIVKTIARKKCALKMKMRTKNPKIRTKTSAETIVGTVGIGKTIAETIVGTIG